jgi:hypothetical protein
MDGLLIHTVIRSRGRPAVKPREGRTDGHGRYKEERFHLVASSDADDNVGFTADVDVHNEGSVVRKEG